MKCSCKEKVKNDDENNNNNNKGKIGAKKFANSIA